MFDKKGDGSINCDNFRVLMNGLGKISSEEIEEMIKEADLDGNGTIDYAGRCHVTIMQAGVFPLFEGRCNYKFYVIHMVKRLKQVRTAGQVVTLVHTPSIEFNI